MACTSNDKIHNSVKEVAYKSFKSDSLHFTLEYPENWEIVYSIDSNSTFLLNAPLLDSTDTYQENFHIWAETLPIAISDSIYKQATLTELKISNPSFNITKLTDTITKFGSFGRYRFDFTTSDSNAYEVQGFTLLNKTKGYNLIFTSELKNKSLYQAELMHMIQTFNSNL
ncbi:MAG: hypothetical protein E6Q58_03250 [Niabella sp.]|nr:MAG: hypothetical protein E6Q58_03250 [Niabella sp.]